MRDNNGPLAVILPSEEIGGHETMLLEWLGQAAARGLEIEIHCRAGSELILMAAAADIPTREIRYPTPAARGWTSGSQNLRAAIIAVKRLPRSQPVLLAPGAMQAALTYLAACVVFRRRIVCYVPFVHDGRTLGFKRPRVRDWVTRMLARQVKIWVTITPLHRHGLQQRWGVRSPIFVVANRLRSLSESPQIAREHADALPLRVLYLGRFDAFQKGLDWLLSVLEAKPEWASPMHFTFQGRGGYMERLRTLTAGGSSTAVTIAPWGNAGTALGCADVLLICSRFEGFPLVAIEAL
ncbi:MAG: glycosyltransferase, partial [Acidobacteriota bacterium]|nr:glycosyltransferase [Acidobacteriota bacterium]